MLKVANSVIDASRITGVLPVVNGGTGVTTSTGTGNTVLSASPTLSGDVTLSTGNLIPGTAAKGVNFTANTPAAGMTSQLINWYEEGTFTPAYSPTTGSFTSISIVSSGRYRRIGSTVFFWVDIRTNAAITVGTASGTLNITGLPFTSGASGGYGMCSVFQQFNLGSSFSSLGVVVEAGQSRLYLAKNSSNGNVTYVQASELQTTGGSFDNLIGLSGMYTV